MSWTSADIPHQGGRLALVTGANSGIGLATARILAGHGAQVVLACRDTSRGANARDSIRARHPDAAVEAMQLDLASLDSIRAFCDAVRQQHRRLDLLVNNAGVMTPPPGRTADGFELQLGVNHLGHFALTGLLLELLLRAPAARVVTLSSLAARLGRLELSARRRRGAARAYAQSKLANLVFSLELHRRLQARGHGVRSLAAHPGWTGTNLQSHVRFIRWLNPLLAQTPAQGARPTLYAATSPEARGGEFFGPDGRWELRGAPTRARVPAAARDPSAAARLWSVSEELTGVRYAL